MPRTQPATLYNRERLSFNCSVEHDKTCFCKCGYNTCPSFCSSCSLLLFNKGWICDFLLTTGNLVNIINRNCYMTVNWEFLNAILFHVFLLQCSLKIQAVIYEEFCKVQKDLHLQNIQLSQSLALTWFSTEVIYAFLKAKQVRLWKRTLHLPFKTLKCMLHTAQRTFPQKLCKLHICKKTCNCSSLRSLVLRSSKWMITNISFQYIINESLK